MKQHRLSLLLSTLFLVTSSAYPSRLVQGISQQPNDANGITEIRLEHAGCNPNVPLSKKELEKICPRYTVVLRNDGTAIYIGQQGAERQGQYVGTFSSNEFNLMARFIDAQGFFQLDPDRGVSHGELLRFTVIRGGISTVRETRIVEFLTPELWAINATINGVASKIKWRKSDQRIVLSEPASLLLTAIPTVVRLPVEGAGAVPPGCEPSKSQVVQLTATVTGLDITRLLYTFSVTGGRVTGESSKATWDLSGTAPGRYRATLEAEDNNGKRASGSVEVTVERCAVEPPPERP